MFPLFAQMAKPLLCEKLVEALRIHSQSLMYHFPNMHIHNNIIDWAEQLSASKMIYASSISLFINLSLYLSTRSTSYLLLYIFVCCPSFYSYLEISIHLLLVRCMLIISFPLCSNRSVSWSNYLWGLYMQISSHVRNCILLCSCGWRLSEMKAPYNNDYI